MEEVIKETNFKGFCGREPLHSYFRKNEMSAIVCLGINQDLFREETGTGLNIKLGLVLFRNSFQKC